MHICLVNRWYPDEKACCGGIAAYNYNLAHALIELGHQVTVIASRASKEIPSEIFDDKVRVIRLYNHPHSYLAHTPILGRYLRVFQLFLYSLLVYRQLRKIEGENSPDIIEFAEIEAEGLVYLLQSKRRPTIVRCHTPMFILKRYYQSHELPKGIQLISWAEKCCIRHTDGLTAPSFDLCKEVSMECGIPLQNLTVIPNGVNTEVFCPAQNNKKTESNTMTVLCVSRLARVKGTMVLAEAAAKVVETFANIHFVFIGVDSSDGQDSTWSAQLRKYFDEKQMQQKVSILIDVDQVKLLNWYHRADLAVVPSLLYESFSYTCAQAMACGIPVIASNIGGIPETVDNGVNGCLVKPGDADALAEAIRNLATDKKLRLEMGHAGVVKVRQKFDHNHIARLFLETAQNVLSKKGQNLTCARAL